MGEICEECGRKDAKLTCADTLPLCMECYRIKHDKDVILEVLHERSHQRKKGYDEAHDDSQGKHQWNGDIQIRISDMMHEWTKHHDARDVAKVRRLAIQAAAMCVALAQHIDRLDE